MQLAAACSFHWHCRRWCFCCYSPTRAQHIDCQPTRAGSTWHPESLLFHARQSRLGRGACSGGEAVHRERLQRGRAWHSWGGWQLGGASHCGSDSPISRRGAPVGRCERPGRQVTLQSGDMGDTCLPRAADLASLAGFRMRLDPGFSAAYGLVAVRKGGRDRRSSTRVWATSFPGVAAYS